MIAESASLEYEVRVVRPLDKVPSGSYVFVDANVFVYALGGKSGQCTNVAHAKN